MKKKNYGKLRKSMIPLMAVFAINPLITGANEGYVADRNNQETKEVKACRGQVGSSTDQRVFNQVKAAGDKLNAGKDGSGDAPLSEEKKEAAKESSYASNCKLGIGAEVNPQTGQLSLNLSNINLAGMSKEVDVNFGLSMGGGNYKGGSSVFDLKEGWKFNIDFMDVSDINEIKLYSSSGCYTKDDRYDSGLRYVKTKALKFSESYGEIDRRPYKYVLECLTSGTKEYFDYNGKLISIADRFQNKVMYDYDRNGTVFNSRLIGITDSFGQKISVYYGGQSPTTYIKITMPDDRTCSYEFKLNEIVVQDITGRVGNIFLEKGRIKEIKYQSGGSIQYEYKEDAIPFINQGKLSSFCGVVRVIESSGNDASKAKVTEYDYQPAGEGSQSFAGYMDYSAQNDALMESGNNGYRYCTKITQKRNEGDSCTKQWFNFLHLPMKTAVYYGSEITPKCITETKYLGQTDGSGSQDFPVRMAELSSNYNLPAETKTTTALASNRIHIAKTKYNEYSQPVEVIQYTDGKETALKLTEYFDAGNSGFHQVYKETLVDHIPKDETIITVNQLGSNKLYISESAMSKSGQNGTEKRTFLEVDEHGRVKSEKLVGNGTETSKKINYNLSKNVLEIKTIDAENAEKINRVDIRNGNTLSEIDALGNKTTYDYSENGLVVTKKFPDGSWEKTDNRNTNISIVSNSKGLVKTSIIDGLGNVIEEYDNGGINGQQRLIGTKKYNEIGKVSEESDMFGHIMLHFYNDWQGRETLSKDYLGNEVSIVYNDDELTATKFFNGIKESMEYYDDNGQVIQSVSYLSGPAGKNSISIAKYNGKHEEIESGLKIQASDTLSSNEEGFIVKGDNDYGIEGKPEKYELSTNDGTSAVSTWKRNLFGDAISRHTVFKSVSPGVEKGGGILDSEIKTYNNVGKLVELKNQLGQIIRYTYDGCGNLSTMTDFAGNTFSYAYDCMGRMVSMKGNNILQVNEYYPEVGNDASSGQLRSRSVSIGGVLKDRITYEYDNKRGLLKKITYMDNKSMSMSYDYYGRVTTVTDYAGVETIYQYVDGTKNIRSISNAFGSVTYDYYTKDDDILLGTGDVVKNAKYGNGTVVHYEYTHSRQTGKAPKLKSIEMKNLAAIVMSKTEYIYDEQDRIVCLIQSSDKGSIQDANTNNSKFFTYNGMGQVIEEKILDSSNKEIMTTCYKYDINGNILSRTISASGGTSSSTTYKYNAIDQLVNLAEDGVKKEFVYDANGNMTAIKENGVIAKQFVYDELNELVEYKDADSDVIYEYNAESLRKCKYYADNPDGWLKFYYSSSGEIIDEADAEGGISSYLTAGEKVLRTVLSTRESKPAKILWYVKNGKDVIGTTDVDGKDIVDKYQYTAYGKDINLNEVKAGDIHQNKKNKM